MTTSTNGKNFIKQEEGYRLTVYKDSEGYLTVGYGHKVVAADNLKLGDTITSSRADTFFDADLKTNSENAINALSCASKLSQNQFDALASICYNGGPGVLNTNDMKTMFTYPGIFRGLTPTTPIAELYVLAEVVKDAFTYGLAQGLAPRRNREADLFCTGQQYGHNVIG